MFKFKLYKLSLTFLLIFSSWAQAAPSFSNIYIFGDSLSDTGNLGAILGDFPPPYYMNRASNGPLAVETLAAQLGLSADAILVTPTGSNYSVAGATANTGIEGIDLGVQVSRFNAVNGYIAPADSLYVIFIGGNDVRLALATTDDYEAKSLIMSAANEVKLAINNLSQAGAKSFLLVNAPNVGIIPETRLIAEKYDTPELLKRGRKLSKQYSKALHKVAVHMEDENDIDITEFNLFRFFNKLVRKADKLGFTNTTDACVSTVTFIAHPECDFDKFIFFDEIHPTARVHAIVGDAMAEAILDEYDDED